MHQYHLPKLRLVSIHSSRLLLLCVCVGDVIDCILIASASYPNNKKITTSARKISISRVLLPSGEESNVFILLSPAFHRPSYWILTCNILVGSIFNLLRVFLCRRRTRFFFSWKKNVWYCKWPFVVAVLGSYP